MSSQVADSSTHTRSRVAAWALWDCGATGLNAIVITFVFADSARTTFGPVARYDLECTRHREAKLPNTSIPAAVPSPRPPSGCPALSSDRAPIPQLLADWYARIRTLQRQRTVARK